MCRSFLSFLKFLYRRIICMMDTEDGHLHISSVMSGFNHPRWKIVTVIRLKKN